MSGSNVGGDGRFGSFVIDSAGLFLVSGALDEPSSLDGRLVVFFAFFGAVLADAFFLLFCTFSFSAT